MKFLTIIAMSIVMACGAFAVEPVIHNVTPIITGGPVDGVPEHLFGVYTQVEINADGTITRKDNDFSIVVNADTINVTNVDVLQVTGVIRFQLGINEGFNLILEHDACRLAITPTGIEDIWLVQLGMFGTLLQPDFMILETIPEEDPVVP